MIFFFIWRKNNALFSRYLDFYFSVKSTDFTICDVIIDIMMELIFLLIFFLILSTTKMKFGQILVCCMTNISNIFLIQWWRLETSSRPLYDFIEMTKKRGLAICNSWQLLFLIVSFSPFQKYQALKSWHNWLFSNWSRLLNWKEPGT